MRRIIKALRFYALFATLIAFVGLTSTTAFADPQPGDACSVANAYRTSGGPENAGKVFSMTCQGGVWVRITESDTSGNLGVKTADPKAPLHVGGEAIIGSTTGLACDANRAGALRYNSTSNYIELCNGTGWSALVSGGGGAPNPSCGGSQALSVAGNYTVVIAAGCTIQVKAWGSGGAKGDRNATTATEGSAGGGGGYATASIGPLVYDTTFYITVGGGGTIVAGGSSTTGFTGGYGFVPTAGGSKGGGGGGASGVWTGSWGGTPRAIAAGGGGGCGAHASGGNVCTLVGNPGGLGAQNGSSQGGNGYGAAAASGGGGGGGGGYATGGAGGNFAQPGNGGTSYAIAGGGTATGSGTSPGNTGDVNRPTNAGRGCSGTSYNCSGDPGAVWYTSYGTPAPNPAPANDREVLFVSNGSYTGAPNFVVDGNLNVGVGTATPKAPLHVGGEAIIGASTGLACDTDRRGGIRYNSVSTKMEFCNGSTWQIVGSGVPVPPAGVNGQIQFNSNGSLGAEGNLFWDQANGRLGINDNSPDAELHVVGDIHYTGMLADVSDRQLKTAITPLPAGQADRLDALQAVSFRMKNDPNGRVELGLIAQDVEKVYPELVLTQPDGTKSLNYIGLIGPIIAILQEQQEQIEALEMELKALKDTNRKKAATGRFNE